MQIKRILFLSLLFIGCHNIAYAGIASPDYVFVSTDIHGADFHTKLNRNTQQLTASINNVETAQVANDTLTEADMADEINPRVRTYEGASCEFVYSGLQPATDSDLTSDISAGTAYPRGYRVNKSSGTSHTYTASRWTWVDLDQNGDFQYTVQAIGSSTPSVASNSIRLARVSTDGTTINSVLDLRTTSCTAGPFSIIKDATGEASLEDIVKNGNGGWENGLNITTNDSTGVYVQPGTVYVNGQYRTLSSALDLDGAVTASPSTGGSGIDTGALAANTNYHVYAVADLDGDNDVTGVLSTSASAPSGATNYRRIGEASTDNSGAFTTADTVSISYQGAIRQIRRVSYTNQTTGTTTTPLDDTPPLITEGDEYMRLRITPTSATSKLKIDVNGFWTAGTTSFVVALCKVGVGTCIEAVSVPVNGLSNVSFTAHTEANSVTEQTFTVRAGAGGGTTYFNGNSGGRYFGGAGGSTITITEYQ